MSKELKVTITLNFSDDIPQGEEGTIVENIAIALKNHIDHSENGLVGHIMDGYTTAMSLESPNFMSEWDYRTNTIQTI
jgi:hypothetical protein